MPNPGDILRTLGGAAKKAKGVDWDAEALRSELEVLTISKLKERATADGLKPNSSWTKGDYVNRIIMNAKNKKKED